MGEDRRDYEMAEVDQCWSVVAGVGQWWYEVGAGVEQGHQCGLFGGIQPPLRQRSIIFGNQNAPKKAIWTYMALYA